MRSLILSISMVLFFSTNTDSTTITNTIYNIEIKRFGIYEALKTGHHLKATGSSEYVSKIKETKFIEQTSTIPLTRGLIFGFEFIVNGPNVGEIVRFLIRGYHPTMLSPSSGNEMTSYEYEELYTIGELHMFGYRLENDYELVPGNWSIEIWYDNSFIIKKTFNLLEQ